ncbi:monovalent cation/H(+) antiporter subunit G [Alkalicoccus daliensis]|uniref:monovalent cation/H(+) antiporter subunit G n=1 Tax=Alkalicoccus daliensis TaxID=745820 RepID=UPI000B898029|nr:monovalent cation/H(+) antiporter subunit G [Alkalicoccus daliensis]
MVEVIISIFLLLGGILSFLGSVGILRFPDVYGRLHAATKSATLGVIGIVLATFLYFLVIHDLFVGKLLLGIVFVFLTAPVGAFMISRAAYRTGVPLSSMTQQDDLKAFMKKDATK